ncbi:MAG: hypothetical protein OHK93_007808 [Ramalina farinacea]|uniref:DUF7729 domain-containing protein n=1 Tax=Ramalina farinacea TaxID=258253 RepID=A0AA43QL77_9LECA|nr:hypothetical protein [Ramalina farinacea]
MSGYASSLRGDSACGGDYNKENPIVRQAYNGLVAYDTLYHASCLKGSPGADGKTSDYCYTNAVTNSSSPTDTYVYYIPLGLSLPAGSMPTCSQCLKDTMGLFATAAGNKSQPASLTYTDAAGKIDIQCGSNFVNQSVPGGGKSSSAPPTSASGSDDQHLNIHSYQPENSAAPFSLSTTVSTGHTANIFSAKFMPHSDDRTLVTCAGDAEVRVFDIEYSGRNPETSANASIASTSRGQRFQNTYKGVRYLSDGNTNARVYRSHGDRVKRIVTESSPNLFLTCSEDGEVRQFDLRLPSAAYPPPHGGRGFLPRRMDSDRSEVPPPLISYKRYNLDLNTISCSPSQPHYIALGGAHLHCLLHDRRMIGRDVEAERGTPDRASPASNMSATEEDMMGKATRCVRKFAPDGRRKMRVRDNRHITACKISDANPNELIASCQRSSDGTKGFVHGQNNTRAKSSGDRKRKRKKTASSTSVDVDGDDSRRRSASEAYVEDKMALRVRYENGQSEDVEMRDVIPNLPASAVANARESVFTESQKRSLQIAKSTVKIRKLVFSLEASPPGATLSQDPARHVKSFTSALGFAASCLPEMKETSRTWRYPMDPSSQTIELQQTLRFNRTSSQRFVQAAGTLSRVLGGKLQTASRTSSPALKLFDAVDPIGIETLPRASQDAPHTKREEFSYTFLKAILLWLDGGPQKLLSGFTKPTDHRSSLSFFHLPENASDAAIHDILIPYLLAKASDNAILDVSTSRFEPDESRQLFKSEISAVIAFSNAIQMPLEDLSRAIMPANGPEERSHIPAAQDRVTAVKYWGFRVGRGLLLNAGEDVNYQFVDIAFGGLGSAKVEDDRSHENINPEEVDPVVQDATVIKRHEFEREAQGSNVAEDNDQPHDNPSPSSRHESTTGSDEEVIRMDDLHAEIADRMAEDDANNGDDDDDEVSDGGDSDEGDEDENDEDAAAAQSFLFQSTRERGMNRNQVEDHVPCYPHTRSYRGHCNVKTVKDANFFGLQDEYVVSGSDSGHLFIWDKKTTQLLNILQGDSEVTNVVQGHPYEPLIAASGIDHTIKIFSPDTRAQEDAKNGINISSSIYSSRGHSSLSRSSRFQRNRGNTTQPDHNDADSSTEGLASRKRMQQSYQIVAQNDAMRQGGMRDAFITVGPFPALRTAPMGFAEWLALF